MKIIENGENAHILYLDFSKAFDTVNHTKLLQAVSNSTLNHNSVRWLVAYLRGRSAFCRYNRATSVCHAVRTGRASRISHLPPVLQLLRLFLSLQRPTPNWLRGRRTCSCVVREPPSRRRLARSPCRGCGRLSTGARPTNLCSQVPRHPFHPRLPPIPHSPFYLHMNYSSSPSIHIPFHLS